MTDRQSGPNGTVPGEPVRVVKSTHVYTEASSIEPPRKDALPAETPLKTPEQRISVFHALLLAALTGTIGGGIGLGLKGITPDTKPPIVAQTPPEDAGSSPESSPLSPEDVGKSVYMTYFASNPLDQSKPLFDAEAKRVLREQIIEGLKLDKKEELQGITAAKEVFFIRQMQKNSTSMIFDGKIFCTAKLPSDGGVKVVNFYIDLKNGNKITIEPTHGTAKKQQNPTQTPIDEPQGWDGL